MTGNITSKCSRAAGLTDRCGWKFMRVAGLLSVAFMGLGVCFNGYRFYLADYWLQPNLTCIAVITWFIVMGMMLAQIMKPSKRVTRIMGGLAGTFIIARIALNYVHLGIFTLRQSMDIPWLYAVILFVILISVCLGAYIQNEFGDGLYRGRTVKVALIALVTMIGMIALMRSLKALELSAFVSSSIHSFNILASIFIPLSAAVMFKSRVAYRLTRHLVVKFVLLLMALVPLTFVFGTCDILTMIVFLSPYIIALAASAPTLARRMVEDLKWF